MPTPAMGRIQASGAHKLTGRTPEPEPPGASRSNGHTYEVILFALESQMAGVLWK